MNHLAFDQGRARAGLIHRHGLIGKRGHKIAQCGDRQGRCDLVPQIARMMDVQCAGEDVIAQLGDKGFGGQCRF